MPKMQSIVSCKLSDGMYHLQDRPGSLIGMMTRLWTGWLVPRLIQPAIQYMLAAPSLESTWSGYAADQSTRLKRHFNCTSSHFTSFL